MALANIAWILASHGERVLVIDWDLEAPGLHRYFRPFIDDKEMIHTAGVIDFLWQFVEGARHNATPSTTQWFEDYSHLERLATSLNWEFPASGTIDLVPSGRQGASYASTVTSFNWVEFYEKLGGGVLLEAVKRNVRAEYDYILIDSRTGISDSSGICTIQMPDELVVCFTLNMQSIVGAAATADSAFQQRMKRQRTPGIKVWPVPMRVELAERDRLERARDDVRERFKKFLHHLLATQRESYWGSVEVLYQPFFAYEEALAVLAERRQQTGSLLQSYENLAGYLTEGHVKSLGHINEEKRRQAALVYSDTRVGPFFLSYSSADTAFATQLVAALESRLGSGSILWDRNLLRAGDEWPQALSAGINKAQSVLTLLSPPYLASEHAAQEAAYSLGRGIRVVPILMPGMSWSFLNNTSLISLRKHFGFEFVADPARQAKDQQAFEREVDELARFLRTVGSEAAKSSSKSTDPQRGKFGGQSERDGYSLTADVSDLGDDWFEVVLQVSRTNRTVVLDEVEFHLHPTFEPSVRRVTAKNGVATLQLEAWGAFTVGAVVLNPLTQLELNLSTLKAAPKAFRER